MIRKISGLSAFILTGLGLMTSAAIKYKTPVNTVFLGVICCFFVIGVKDYIKEMENR